MTRRVLIIDQDKKFATDLWIALRKSGNYKISTVRTLNEACLTLIQETQDLAFLPLSNDDRPLRSLLVLQSDLHIILTAAKEIVLPEKMAGKTKGILFKAHLNTALPDILSTIFDQFAPSVTPPTAHAAIHTGILGPRIQSAILTQGQSLITHWGQLSRTEANLIVQTISQDWIETTKTSQVQFSRLPEQGQVFLLYTRVMRPQHPISQEKRYMLTLVAAPEVSLSWLRTRADKLVENLGKVLYTAVSPSETVSPRTPSFAIAWRTQEPIPNARIIPIKHIIERVAIANACALTFIDVQPQLVHAVITCPRGRNSGWAVHTLKSGSEALIQHEFKQTQPLWDKGHYAQESTESLTAAELNIFLPTRNPSHQI